MHSSLKELQRALKGLVVLSAELEAMGNACFDQRVPAGWTAKAYPSLKPLGSWFKDLVQRLDFVTTWIERGIPPAFWVSGFFFPQGFLTAILQNYARKYSFPIDTVSFSFVMRDETQDELTSAPEDGCYIYGLFLEGGIKQRSPLLTLRRKSFSLQWQSYIRFQYPIGKRLRRGFTVAQCIKS